MLYTSYFFFALYLCLCVWLCGFWYSRSTTISVFSSLLTSRSHITTWYFTIVNVKLHTTEFAPQSTKCEEKKKWKRCKSHWAIFFSLSYFLSLGLCQHVSKHFFPELLFSVISVNGSCWLWVLQSVAMAKPNENSLDAPILSLNSIFFSARCNVLTRICMMFARSLQIAEQEKTLCADMGCAVCCCKCVTVACAFSDGCWTRIQLKYNNNKNEQQSVRMERFLYHGYIYLYVLYRLGWKLRSGYVISVTQSCVYS